MPMPQGGQGGFPGGFGQGDRGGTQGTVTAVEVNADGTAAATISVDELPSGVKTKSTGFARIAVEVLAEDVILVPTAAIEGSGSSASVQVLANGKTETRTISTGRQSGAQTEVVSGLNEGENVVYMQSFQGVPGGSGRERHAVPAAERRLERRPVRRELPVKGRGGSACAHEVRAASTEGERA